MDRIIPIIAIVAIIVLVGAVWVVGIYNGETIRNQAANGAWANVEVELQRRFDMVPQVVNVVSGAANFEQETLTEITQLRSQWQTQTNVNDKIETANQFESAISKLLSISEAYPDLKSNQNFLELQAQLEGNENRISVERKRYNDAAGAYNIYIQLIPNSFFLGGKEVKKFYNAPEAAETPPEIPTDFTN